MHLDEETLRVSGVTACEAVILLIAKFEASTVPVGSVSGVVTIRSGLNILISLLGVRPCADSQKSYGSRTDG